MNHDQFYDLCRTGGSCPYPAYQEDTICTRICLQRSTPQLQLVWLTQRLFKLRLQRGTSCTISQDFPFEGKPLSNATTGLARLQLHAGGLIESVTFCRFSDRNKFSCRERRKKNHQQSVYILQKSLTEGRVWVVIWFSCGWQTRWQRGLRRNWHFQGWQGPARMWRDRAPSRVLFALEN